MRRRFLRELASTGLPSGPGPEGVVGRPRDWSVRLAFHGRFRTRAGQPWRKCPAWLYDFGALVPYLDGMVLFAPSMWLEPGRSPRDFATTGRFCPDPNDRERLPRAAWTTPVGGWTTIGGRRLPAGGEALWRLGNDVSAAAPEYCYLSLIEQYCRVPGFGLRTC
jgi:hypothetical protein